MPYVLCRGYNDHDLQLPPNAERNGVKGLSGDDTPTLRTPPVVKKSMRHFERQSNDATFFAVIVVVFGQRQQLSGGKMGGGSFRGSVERLVTSNEVAKS